MPTPTRSSLLVLSLSIALVAPGCGRRCASSPPTVPRAPVVVPGPPACLSQPPPVPPAQVTELAASDQPATPEQLDALEWWTGALQAYAARAWRVCGPEVTP